MRWREQHTFQPHSPSFTLTTFLQMTSTTILPNDPQQTPEYLTWLQLLNQDGTKAAYRFYLTTRHWKEVRSRILTRDNHTCTLCGTPRSFTTTQSMHVHHKTYCRLWREYSTDLITVCARCHKRIHRNRKIKLNKAPSSLPTPRESALSTSLAVQLAYCKEIVTGKRPFPAKRPRGFPRMEWAYFTNRYQHHQK